MNKPRLIKEGDVLSVIRNGWSNHCCCKDMCEAINDIPTAYDIDKVVEQLEEIEVHRNEYSETVECNIEPCSGMSCYECILDKAIEIVKGGLDESRNDSTSR